MAGLVWGPGEGRHVSQRHVRGVAQGGGDTWAGTQLYLVRL